MSIFQKLNAGSDSLRIEAWQQEIEAVRAPRDEASEALRRTRADIQTHENWLQQSQDDVEQYRRGLVGVRSMDRDKRLERLNRNVDELRDKLNELRDQERELVEAFEEADAAFQKIEAKRPAATQEDVQAAEKRLEVIGAQKERIAAKLEQARNTSSTEAREAYSEASALRSLGEIDADTLEAKRKAFEQAEEVAQAAPGLERLMDDLREQEDTLLDTIRELRNEVATNAVAEQVAKLHKLLDSARVRKLIDEIGEHDPGFRLEITTTSHYTHADPIKMQPARKEEDAA